MHDSDDLSDLFEMACDSLSRGEYDKAITLFSEIAAQDPQLEGAFGYRGIARIETGHDQDALLDFAEVLRINPNDAYGYGSRAVALYNLGRYAEALEAVVAALERVVDEDVPPARLTRALLFLRAGQFVAAIPDLEAYLVGVPDDEALQDVLDICKRVQRTGRKDCPDGPDGRLQCGICQCTTCGFSFNTEPNWDWSEQGGVCPYSHCIEMMPVRSGDGPAICSYFGHDCPGGADAVRHCGVAQDERENPDFDLPDLEGFFDEEA